MRVHIRPSFLRNFRALTRGEASELARGGRLIAAPTEEDGREGCGRTAPPTVSRLAEDRRLPPPPMGEARTWCGFARGGRGDGDFHARTAQWPSLRHTDVSRHPVGTSIARPGLHRADGQWPSLRRGRRMRIRPGAARGRGEIPAWRLQ